MPRWERMIALVDMNAFFASIEQLDFPELRGKPVAVTNGVVGTCVITCSYEARAHGVKTGMHLKQARQLCPRIIQRPARPERYAEISTRLMTSLEMFTPDIEIFSVDEAFLDFTRCWRLYKEPYPLALAIQRHVLDVCGCTCSIGVSGDKTTAKFAAKQKKPNGITVIAPWEAEARLRDVPVTELCGIADGIGRFLAARGVYTCGDMKRLPIGVLAKRFGNPGRRIWHMCQGKDYEKLHQDIPPPKTIGHGKVVPPNTRDYMLLLIYLLHMSEKVAARLRRHRLAAKTFCVGLRAREDWIANHYACATPVNDGRDIFHLSRDLLTHSWRGEGIFQVQVCALDPRPIDNQLELFSEIDSRRASCLQAQDRINHRYGEFTVMPARLLGRSTMPNVISPAWRPYGHRQTIQDANVDEENEIDQNR